MYHAGYWDYTRGYGVSFSGAFIKEGQIISNQYIPNSDKKSDTLVLKPHGSINWFNKTNSSEEGIFIFLQPQRRDRQPGNFGSLEMYEKTNLSPDQYKVNLIPPGKKRRCTSNEYISIWNQTKELIRNADHIIAIGFSFNDKDEYVIDELNDIQTKNGLIIEIIDPLGSTLINKYDNIFKTHNVETTHKNFEDYCRWIVKQPGMKNLYSI